MTFFNGYLIYDYTILRKDNTSAEAEIVLMWNTGVNWLIDGPFQTESELSELPYVQQYRSERKYVQGMVVLQERVSI